MTPGTRLPVRMSVRLRLTLLYGLLFFGTGAVLLSVNYALVRKNLPPRVIVERPPDSDVLLDAEPVFGVRAEGIQPADVARLDAAANRFRTETLRELVVQSSAALALMGVASVVLGWVVAGRVLRPVHEITARARRLSEQNLHERLNLSGPPDELKDLADTFDAMLARLDAAFESQGRFVANASHELRTPLAVMRTEIEVAERDPHVTREQLLTMGANLRGVIERTEAVIDGLLTLARSQQDLSRRDVVDLADVADVAVSEREPLVQPYGDVALVTDLASAPTTGDGNLLEHLAGNLVSNAILYNVDGGSVHVRTWTDSSAAAAVLEVANTGEVIAPAVAVTLVEPFRRNAPDRTRRAGAGLGLSIVQAVARAHGGTVDLLPLPAGGLTVTVRLPLAPS